MTCAPARRTAGLAAARVRARVPVQITRAGRHQQASAELVTFGGLFDGREHLACVWRPLAAVPLVRVHSECLTGDVFGSLRCDCGPQLDEAVDALSATGGILLYLRQEGRGIGLYNKLDAYLLQDQGADTFTANRLLGRGEDEREYVPAAQMLLALGTREIHLITNNPEKIDQLSECGITVRSVRPTQVHLNPHNETYLRAKATIARHHLDGVAHGPGSANGGPRGARGPGPARKEMS
jgi:GTP cyclohydrolase II